jgi:hypothetical protein
MKKEEIPRRCASRNDKKRGSSGCPFSRCHSERSEESAVGKTAGGGAKFEEIPRRCAPRNGKKRGAPRNDRGGPRDAPFPAVIPNVVRNLQLRNAFGMDDWDDWDDWDD